MTTLGERVRGDRNVGSDAILRFLALLEPVDERLVPEIRAEHAARTAARRASPRSPSPRAESGVEGRSEP
jgi:hypothetical protein